MRTILVFTAISIVTAAASPTTAGAASKNVLEDAAKIDAIIQSGLAAEKLKPHAMSTDPVFVRRVHLDLVGRIPTRQETLAFLNSKDPKKREKLIDQLLNSEGYVSHHFNYWGDILRLKTLLNGAGQARPAGYSYTRYVKNAIRDNVPYDDFVRSLVSAEGLSWENGAVGYYLRDYGMNLCNMATTTQVFLGTSVHCAQCHDHPFDKWRQMDFYQHASYQYNILTTNNSTNQSAAMKLLEKDKQKGKNPEYRRGVSRAFSEILKPLRFNNVKHIKRNLTLPKDYQYDDAKPSQSVSAKPLFGHEIAAKDSEHPIQGYARWLTATDNPRFTTVIANRMWKKVTGMGLIEPVDEMSDTTEASNPALMKFLENRMRAYDYDLKKFMAMLYNTKTYQRAAYKKDVLPGEKYYYPGPLLRRMSAEQIWDSLVTLIIDEPDAPNPYIEHEMDRTILRTKWIAESVYDQKPGEFLRGAKHIAATQKRLAEEMRKLSERRNAAIEAGDVALSKKLAAEVKRKQGELVKVIQSSVYQPGFKSKVELVSTSLDKSKPKPGAKPVPAAATKDEFLVELAGCVEDGTMSMKELKDSPVLEVVNSIVARRTEELKAWAATEKAREWKEWNVKSTDQQKFWLSYNNLRRNTVTRASNLPQPAPRGHFLREFGQSDKEVVDNHSIDATITQALNLLNNPSVHAWVRNPYSRVRRDIRAAGKPGPVLDSLYLSLFSRKPTEQESKVLLPILAENTSTAPLETAWTLLNTQQFIFIQ